MRGAELREAAPGSVKNHAFRIWTNALSLKDKHLCWP